MNVLTYLAIVANIAYDATPKQNASNEISTGFSSENPGILPSARYAHMNPTRLRMTPRSTSRNISMNLVSKIIPLIVERIMLTRIRMMIIGSESSFKNFAKSETFLPSFSLLCPCFSSLALASAAESPFSDDSCSARTSRTSDRYSFIVFSLRRHGVVIGCIRCAYFNVCQHAGVFLRSVGIHIPYFRILFRQP